MKWISVDERLPEIGAPVICADIDGNVEPLVRGIGGWHDLSYAFRPYPLDLITHWQPFPPPPDTPAVEATDATTTTTTETTGVDSIVSVEFVDGDLIEGDHVIITDNNNKTLKKYRWGWDGVKDHAAAEATGATTTTTTETTGSIEINYSYGSELDALLENWEKETKPVLYQPDTEKRYFSHLIGGDIFLNFPSTNDGNIQVTAKIVSVERTE